MGSRPKAAVRRAYVCSDKGKPVPKTTTAEQAIDSPAPFRSVGRDPTVADPDTADCRRWLDINSRIGSLQDRWAKLECQLDREHSWLKMSPAERLVLPAAEELRKIDRGLSSLFKQRNSALDSLNSRASSLESVIFGLFVAESLLWPEDHPEAHALVARSRRYLIAMMPDARTDFSPTASPAL